MDRFSATNGRSPGGAADHLRDAADHAAHVRYCWINPVKHGPVETPEAWPFSSIHRDMAAGRYTPGAAVR